MMLPTEHRGRGEDALLLSVDNCGGQNKNRYMPWFLSFLVIIIEEKCVELCLMIPGHTKNLCDGRFGLVKRLLRRVDVI